MATIASLDSIEDFRTWLYRRGFSGHTLNAYVSDVKGFYKDLLLTEIPVSQLENAVADWMNIKKHKWAPKTTQRKMTGLRKYAKYHGLPELLEDYVLPPIPRVDAKVLEGGIDDVMRLIEAARTAEERALIAMMGLCGMRIGEALARGPADFNFKERVIRIELGKGMKTRVVPMSEVAAGQLFDAVCEARFGGMARIINLKDRAARKRVTHLAEMAGVQHLASHMLRATFATEAYEQSDHNIVAVQELLGHADVNTTRGYIAPKMGAMRGAVDFPNRPKL